MQPAPTVLTIAGFDPSSGAGVTADLQVFAAHGLFGASCITALTVQSTVGVRASHAVDAGIVSATLACLHADLPPAGIKIGMVGNAANIAAIAAYLERVRATQPHIPVVLDPILRSSLGPTPLGRELLDPEALTLLRTRLLPLVDWTTPNLDELSALTGMSISIREEIPARAFALQSSIIRYITEQSLVSPVEQDAHLPLGVLATGGHLTPPDDLLLTPTGEILWLPGQHIETASTHGTGCALSSAFLCRLVLGDTPHQAALSAKRYVAKALGTAIPRGGGHGPLNLLWPLLGKPDTP